ncbi:MAG: alkaline phosphatase family protein [Acidimicrobiales bacterium]
MAGTERRPPDRRHDERWVLRIGDLGRGLLALAGATVGYRLASLVIPGFSVGGWGQSLVVALMVAVVGTLFRPLLINGAVLLGWAGSILIGLFGQALLIWLTLRFGRSDEVSFWSAFAASWLVAGCSTLAVWLGTAGTNDAVIAGLIRRARRSPATVDDPDVPGVVFVQADGVPYPVLEWGIRAGTLPTMSRWIRSGSHHMAEWRPQLPATTPASQLGILHGTTDGVPAFRWVDRAEGRVYVANRARDAAAIEARHSDGRGLLADDGVSVGNLFTGDAVVAYATMSAVHRMQQDRSTRTALSEFLASPAGLARSVSRSVSEIVRERFQSNRARRRDVQPRCHRGWNFTFERAALNGVMRDLNTSMVGDAILAGRRSIYVDYVDYDGVAHHTGIMQPEALSALEGIDDVLGQLEQIISEAPRPYHVVVLSDHGQSQGTTFADRYGEDLAAVVQRLSEVRVEGSAFVGEAQGMINSMLVGSSRTDTVLGRAVGRASDRLSSRRLGEVDALDAAERVRAGVGTDTGTLGATVDAPAEVGTPATTDDDGGSGDDRFLVFGSGNLGLVYVAGEDHQLTLDELLDRFPGLIPGLVAHPGVGFVVVDTDEHGPVVIGAGGEHHVRDGTVIGDDPLARFGPEAPEFVLRAATMAETPDVYVNSLLDDLGEVAAFEGLVGCHGGLGGWQDRAAVVWPVELPAPDGMVVGADGMYRLLVSWLEYLGHRRGLEARPEPETGPDPDETVA